MSPRHLLLLLPLLAACTNDSYDKGTGPQSLARAEFVEARTGADSTVCIVETDDGETLRLATPLAGSGLRPDTAYRAAMVYKPAGEGLAEALQMQLIPTSRPRPLRDGEAMKTDPVRLESAWMSRNGRYLNLGMYVKVGVVDDGNAKGHLVGFVPADTVRHADGRTTLRLVFFHDKRNMPEYYSQRLYVSIPAEAVEADTAEIVVGTFEGVRTVKIAK